MLKGCGQRIAGAALLFVIISAVVLVRGGGSTRTSGDATPSPTVPKPASMTALYVPAIDAYDPTVRQFLILHPEYGRLTRIGPMPDWASGARREVTTTRSNYLFYFCGADRVTGVWDYNGPGGVRTQVYHVECP